MIACRRYCVKLPHNHFAMKGIVFTEFLEMVEQRYSPQVLERMIAAATLPSGGAYTAVGTYDHGEIWSLVIELSKVVDVSVPDLFKSYGEHLFGRLAAIYPKLIGAVGSTFDLLQGLWTTSFIAKCASLYPDAELPASRSSSARPLAWSSFTASKRHFADLAEGLMRACGRHFGHDHGLSARKSARRATAAACDSRWSLQ